MCFVLISCGNELVKTASSWDPLQALRSMHEVPGLELLTKALVVAAVNLFDLSKLL